ncbi:MAG: hypothetical protein QNK30_15295 [Bacteroidales bacterium]|nr:hypothetical protein [Bacteroidales bacterium]
MHKSMCDACTRYEKQSLIMDKGLSSLKGEERDEKELEDLKKIIIHKLENTGTN